ncbi:MAG: inositol monophosphatase [Candidatus Altiarchaeota archaeon]
MKDRLLKVAVDAAEEAGDFLKKNFRCKIKLLDCKDKHLVSEADVKAEEIILSRIRDEFPEHSILSEEAGETCRDCELEWIVDPLDGTHNYLYGIPLYGVSIAVLEGDKPIVGVIHLPETGETYSAKDGEGSYLNSKKIKVSDREPKDAMIMFESLIYKKPEKKLDVLARLARSVFSTRMFGVATTSFAWLASGRTDGYIIDDAKIWDVTAGAILVSEAGGCSTDFYGTPWNKYSKNIVASNSTVHEALLKTLK